MWGYGTPPGLADQQPNRADKKKFSKPDLTARLFIPPISLVYQPLGPAGRLFWVYLEGAAGRDRKIRLGNGVDPFDLAWPTRPISSLSALRAVLVCPGLSPHLFAPRI